MADVRLHRLGKRGAALTASQLAVCAVAILVAGTAFLVALLGRGIAVGIAIILTGVSAVTISVVVLVALRRESRGIG
jgi:hypothetical protein